MRNWYYFNWLCGDHIVEQHIHNIDVGNWVKQGIQSRHKAKVDVRFAPGWIMEKYMIIICGV